MKKKLLLFIFIPLLSVETAENFFLFFLNSSALPFKCFKVFSLKNELFLCLKCSDGFVLWFYRENAQKDITFLYSTFLFLVLLFYLFWLLKKNETILFFRFMFCEMQCLKKSVSSKSFSFDTWNWLSYIFVLCIPG